MEQPSWRLYLNAAASQRRESAAASVHHTFARNFDRTTRRGKHIYCVWSLKENLKDYYIDQFQSMRLAHERKITVKGELLKAVKDGNKGKHFIQAI